MVTVDERSRVIFSAGDCGSEIGIDRRAAAFAQVPFDQ